MGTKVKTNVRFDVARGDIETITEIVNRGEIAFRRKTKRGEFNRLAALMDITAVHRNGCPLNLARFLVADDATFSHDFFGIRSHIDRDTGTLRDCFLPKCARPDASVKS